MSRALRGLSILLVLLVPSAPVWAGDTWKLTILHTNDRHGRMEMIPIDASYPESPAAARVLSRYLGKGGAVSAEQPAAAPAG